jgi:hypothetical protein
VGEYVCTLDHVDLGIRLFVPPFARDDVALLPFPEQMREEIRSMPLDWWKFVKMLVKLEFTHPTRSLLGSTHYLHDNFERWVEHANAVWDAYPPAPHVPSVSCSGSR